MPVMEICVNLFFVNKIYPAFLKKKNIQKYLPQLLIQKKKKKNKLKKKKKN